MESVNLTPETLPRGAVVHRLTVFGDDGRKDPDAKLRITRVPSARELAQAYWKFVQGRACRYAVLREDRIVRAMYLAPDLLPRRALPLGAPAPHPGEWITTAILLGNTHRAMAGPGIFFRQLDLGPEESWMAPVLMKFQQGVQVTDRVFPDSILHEWSLYGQRWIVERKGHRWSLYGAGNTEPGRISQILAEQPPESAFEYLLALGAVSLDL